MSARDRLVAAIEADRRERGISVEHDPQPVPGARTVEVDELWFFRAMGRGVPIKADAMSPDELHEMAEMARRGLHDLRPWWDPERGEVDPLDDPEVRAEVRRFIGQRWAHLERLRREAS